MQCVVTPAAVLYLTVSQDGKCHFSTMSLYFCQQIASGEHNEKVPEYYFSNPDPYAKVESRPDDAPKRDIKFDENGNIVVKNPSAFWLPEVTIVDEIGGAEYTVTGSYEGTETLDKKLKRIMEQNAADDESDITEDGE